MGMKMNQLGLDGDAGVLADPVHVVGDPGVHVGEDLRLAARARHEGGHADRHVLSGSLLEVEWSTGVSAADADVLSDLGVSVGVDADHALVDVVEELLATVVGHDGPVLGEVHVVGLSAAVVAGDAPAGQGHEVVLELVVKLALAGQAPDTDRVAERHWLRGWMTATSSWRVMKLNPGWR